MKIIKIKSSNAIYTMLLFLSLINISYGQLFLMEAIKTGCDLKRIRNECYKKFSLNNITDTKTICCKSWDIYECFALETCKLCGENLSNNITNSFRSLQAKVCSSYPYRSLKCNLLQLSFFGIIFISFLLIFAIGYFLLDKFIFNKY